MKTFIEIAKGLAVIIVITAGCIFVFSSVKKPIQIQFETQAKKDSVERSRKDLIRYGVPVAAIDACKLYRVKTAEGDIIYWTICNAPGVSSSVTISPNVDNK